MESVTRSTSVSARLAHLRRRLTGWYAGTFFVILLVLGIGLFASVTRRFDDELDASLRRTAMQLSRVAATRGAAVALRDMWVPDRTLLIADTSGTAVAGAPLDRWVRIVATSAWRDGTATSDTHRAGDERILRAVAHPVGKGSAGTPFIAIAIADEVELEDRYWSLILVFAALALSALVLVTIGGWVVAGQSITPVEEAFTHMRRFMADAAHELRTPLTITRSRAEVTLQRARSGEEYVTALTAIERETERLGHIVEDLLMLARADTGERPMERRRFFLDDVALDAAQNALVMAERKHVRLDIEEVEESPIVGDTALVRQLVLILLDNAIKYTPSGGQVRVGVRPSGTTALVTVSDTGIGIPTDQLPHVFDRFFRVDPARSRAPGDALSEGAGLGLSIARWIAEQHGAQVKIESTEGSGTQVVVVFPLA